MKKGSLWFGSLTCLLTFTTFTAHAALPIAEYLFDEPVGGVFATNTGTSSVTTPLEMLRNALWNDSHGPGIWGSGLDHRFVDGSTSGVAQQTTGQNTTSVDDNNLDGFVSFTLMGWMKSEMADVGNERQLIWKKDSLDGFGLDGGESGPNQNYLRLRVNGGAVVSGPDWGNVNQWTFFAVTFDGSLGANNVKFYKGDQGGGFSNATLVSTHTLAETSALDSPIILAVGGRNNAPRSFDGVMDVVRIFGSQADASGALGLGEIQFWQTQIPEPSTAALALAGAAALLRRRAKRME